MLRLPDHLERFLIEPDDPAYARVSSTYTTKARPAGVLFPRGDQDIADALAAVADTSLPLSIRSGGHGLSGRSTNDGGLVIDLSQLDQIEVVDRDRHLVRIGPGARWGTVAERLATEGLVISSGDHGNVGVGGSATGGGVGWLARGYGLTIDHVRAAELITVDGRRLRVTDTTEGDLFWALRGAGAGIGVITAYEIEAMPLTGVGVAGLTYLVEPHGQTLAAWAAALSRSPRELSAMANLMMQGDNLVLSVTAVVASSHEDVIRDALAPLLAAGPVHAQTQVVPYDALVSPAHQHANVGQQAATATSAALRELDEDAARALARAARSRHRPLIQFRSLDGAVRDVDPDATAFHHRSHQFLVAGVVFGSHRDAALADAWGPVAALADGAYPGFESRGDADSFRRAYPGQTGQRVSATWQRMDPRGLIRPITCAPAAVRGRGSAGRPARG
ncbi:FAD/FMN-containing dehydrogenase [Asanoa hainanensis]|uniref:FAD/FMN-containing dehydrogenase n=1 Tax=Asanoa hainanensis TaxID=560556 RepID=A0A239P9C2_9ACTN|nr:FAD-dependent oxidoreductase [Asanoa hainanensis]SNT63158.1 FAD/FMN-containing dehydrogenase [Asanoa hainanensis]